MNNIPLKILLIEDDEDDYILVRNMLSEIHGYEVELDWVSGFQDALGKIQDCGFDVCLLDYRLGEHNGLELLHEARTSDCRAPIIFLTGLENYELDVEAMKAGATDYLVKGQIFPSLLERSIRYALERKRAEDALRRSEENLRSLLYSMDDFVFVLDPDGRFTTYYQPGNRKELYVPSDDFLGKPYREVLPPTVADKIESSLEQLTVTGITQQFDYSLIIEGKKEFFDARISPIRSPSGGLGGFTAVVRNITDRKKMEKALLQKEKLKTLGQISAEVAHEIRNPLVSIGGFARRLREKYSDSPEATIIIKEAQRLEKILNSIKDYLRPVEVRAQECSLNTIITDCIGLLSPQLDSKSIRCRLDLAPELSPAMVDPDILCEILINLMRNAMEYMEDGTLTIKSFEKEETLNILLKSPSRGQAKDPALLFLPFDEGGESIGLPLCYRLLKDMGGILSLSHEDDSAVFIITLPKYSPSEEAEL
jgi:two-component system, NtrC family, sensor histidine kinase HydH